MEKESKPDVGCVLPLDVRTVQELWSKTYNTQGKPDWSHIYPYYHPDIVFQDSIQRLEGLEAFKALCTRLTDRCKELRMEIHAVARDKDVIFIQWTMTMMFRKYPSTPVYGSTVLRLHADGRILEQRDYYDLWGDIFNGIPWFKKPYRKFMQKKFG
ncbi:MAG: nuclear transport factor 2 family protein [Spirochaetia bacterium]|jgi:limonene-1,2-epoxide hydrolase|nr:nuclear transport factor 2 family protein [Spirochaetia bacterium]